MQQNERCCGAEEEDDSGEIEEQVSTGQTTTVASGSSRNIVHTLAKKVCSALEEEILSLRSDAENGLLPSLTAFKCSEESSLQFILQRIRKECPELCKDRQELVFQMLKMLPDEEDEVENDV